MYWMLLYGIMYYLGIKQCSVIGLEDVICEGGEKKGGGNEMDDRSTAGYDGPQANRNRAEQAGWRDGWIGLVCCCLMDCMKASKHAEERAELSRRGRSADSTKGMMGDGGGNSHHEPKS